MKDEEEKLWVVLRGKHRFPRAHRVARVIDDMGKFGAYVQLYFGFGATTVKKLRTEKQAKEIVRRWKRAVLRVLADPYLVNPESFKLPLSRYERGERWMTMTIEATNWDDTGVNPIAWVVREGGQVLNKEGKWEIEPTPGGRSEGFIERTRWKSAEEAVEAVRQWEQKQINQDN